MSNLDRIDKPEPLELAAMLAAKRLTPNEMNQDLKKAAGLDAVVPELMAICKKHNIKIPCSKPWYGVSTTGLISERFFCLSSKGIRIGSVLRFSPKGGHCFVPYPVNRVNKQHCVKAVNEGISVDQIIGNIIDFAEEFNKLNPQNFENNLKKLIDKFKSKLGITLPGK